jgi:hypothetical protein
LRRSPERDYVWNKTKPGDLGLDGSAAINALFADTFLQGKDKGDDIVAGVSKYLARMQIAERLEVRPLGRSTRYAIVVHHDGVAANLKDVGIGISQVLPVLTLAHFAPPGSTVLLEEPEIHLHPLAQAVLAELFVEISRTRQIQFIVETHSEHLFRRLQTLIAGQSLTVEDCAMYFVERDGARALLRTLEANSFGAITNWPEKFFGDALGETREQARLMFERQKMSTSAVDFVDVLYDDDGHGYLDEPLASVVHDLADRKIVAAALEAITAYHECAVANAADTDWYDWQGPLDAAGIFVEQILPEWSRAKWQSKQK